MAADTKNSSNIPIRFVDSDESAEADYRAEPDFADPEVIELSDTQADLNDEVSDSMVPRDGETRAEEPAVGGPELAELIATRAELKRLQMALAEAQDTAARRQADFENYRKRIERDRGETHNRIVADVARKLLPVVDNLGRALEAERSVETQESKEFRHFLHGVELISKQLSDVLESLGIHPISAVGKPFDPHIHEAVVTEQSDKFEPDTVIEEIARGYKIGDRLLRPSMVKVAARNE
jgi:molecular chaperone GrpE